MVFRQYPTLGIVCVNICIHSLILECWAMKEKATKKKKKPLAVISDRTF